MVMLLRAVLKGGRSEAASAPEAAASWVVQTDTAAAAAVAGYVAVQQDMAVLFGFVDHRSTAALGWRWAKDIVDCRSEH